MQNVSQQVSYWNIVVADKVIITTIKHWYVLRILTNEKSFKILLNHIILTIYIFFKGEPLEISSKFKDGDVIFTWNNVSSTYHVFNRNTTGNKLIPGYNKTINSTEYTVRKALLYDSIYTCIKVNVPGKDDFYNITYEGKSFH